MAQEITEENSMRRIRFLDVYRGIGIILMIMGHIGFGDKFDYWLHSFHMPLWFIISGYFFKDNYSFKSILQKKVRQLIIPYEVFGGVLPDMVTNEARCCLVETTLSFGII